MVETLSAFRQESIFSSSRYAQHKITSSKHMRNVYKTDWDDAHNAAALTGYCVCVALCTSPYILMCDHVQNNVVLIDKLWCEWTMILKHDTSWSPSLFPSREILRSSLLSSLWSEAAIAIDYSKRVRSTLLEIVLYSQTLNLCQSPVTQILFPVSKCQQFNNVNP